MPEALAMGKGLATYLARLAEAGDYERVGVALGVRDRIMLLFPVANVVGSPVAFLADPLDMIAAHSLADNLGLQVVALYHTHPHGPPEPSGRDVEGMRLWPIPWLISSPLGIRAWILGPAGPREEPLIIADS